MNYFILTNLFIIILLIVVICNGQNLKHSQHRNNQQENRQRMLHASVTKTSKNLNPLNGTMTAVQCKCKDLKECSKELAEFTEKCQVKAKCENFLKKIGNSNKIRECLKREQNEMDRLEDCVEKKVGPIGCTNDAHPKNLTLPLMQIADGKPKRNSKEVSKQQDVGHAPMELSDYLMCVDECAMNNLNNEAKTCTNPQQSCATKLQCALEPSNQKDQKAFNECEKSLNLLPEKRFKMSCQCLKSAGVNIQCPK